MKTSWFQFEDELWNLPIQIKDNLWIKQLCLAILDNNFEEIWRRK